MAYRIEYVNTSTSRVLQLNGLDATSGITLGYIGDIGFGLAPLHQITVRGPLQQGDTYVDFRLDPRVIQIPLVVQPGTGAGQTQMQRLYYARQVLSNIFNPLDGGYIRFYPDWDTTPSVARVLNTRVLGGLEFNVDPQMPYDFRTVVNLRASDPLWYDDGLMTQIITNAQFGSFVGISNPGNHYSWPSIIVTGPVTNFRIASTKGSAVQFIQVNGTIAAGDMWFFDLTPSTKNVQDLAGVVRIGAISLDSNFATFNIPYGSSSLRCTGTGTTAATSVEVNWTPAYSGV